METPSREGSVRRCVEKSLPEPHRQGAMGQGGGGREDEPSPQRTSKATLKGWLHSAEQWRTV